MDANIEKYVSQVVEKLTGNKNLLEGFKKDPVGTVKKLLANLNLDDDLLKTIATAVKGKINLDDVAGKAGGILGMLKKLFKK